MTASIAKMIGFNWYSFVSLRTLVEKEAIARERIKSLVDAKLQLALKARILALL